MFPDPVHDETAAAHEPGGGIAVLAGGCFWCVEAVYRQLAGVQKVVSGYAGGTAETATYEAVCSGTTNHAEAVLIEYDPAQITYGQILKVFFSVAHDPTQLDRQGPDVGPQYRSAIFYTTPEQASTARAYVAKLDESGVFSHPIVTQIQVLDTFYPAEAYHQDYYEHHPNNPYIYINDRPKVEALKTRYPDLYRDR